MTTDKGVWNLQQVRDKQLQSLWTYSTTLKELYTWGSKGQGRLGLNDRTTRSSPIQIPGTTWRSVSCDAGPYNSANSLATRTDGTLWAWGSNWQGQLGQNTNANPSDAGISSPVQIPGTTWSENLSVSQHASSAVKTDGTLWMWGYNEAGALGQNNRTSYSSPVQVGSDTTWTTTAYVHDGNWEGFILGKTDATMWGVGSNSFGILGQNQGSPASYSSPVQIPGSWSDARAASQNTTFATKTDGSLWAWGNNGDGRLGQNNQTSYSSPVQIGSATDWGTTAGKVSARDNAGIAIKTDGTMWVWGRNDYGQLGQNIGGTPGNRSSPVQIPGTTWATVTGGNEAMIAVKTDGTAWGWGDNDKGSIGDNTTVNRSSPTQIPGTDWDIIKSAGIGRMLGFKKL